MPVCKIGLSRSCSNTNVTSTDVTIAHNGKSDNGTELMSHKCCERRLSMIIPRSLGAIAVCNVIVVVHRPNCMHFIYRTECEGVKIPFWQL